MKRGQEIRGGEMALHEMGGWFGYWEGVCGGGWA